MNNQSLTITIITHDGYNDWNVSRVKVVDVEGPFTPDACLKAYIKAYELDEDECDSLSGITGGNPVQNANVITSMGEENGITFVGS
jgi:hypothetical protein